jgi:tetratricopeptide (TPR) repeat protein
VAATVSDGLAADAHDMGPVIQRFGRYGVLEALGVLLLAGGAAAFFMIKEPFDSSTNVVLGAGAAGLGVVLALAALRPAHVLICEKGLVAVLGRSVRAHDWEDITSVDHREVFVDRYYKPVYTLRVLAHRAGNAVTISNEGNIAAMDLRYLRSRHFLEISLKDGSQLDLGYLGAIESAARVLMRELQRNAVKNLLKEAIGLDARGQFERAIVAFEEVIRKSPYNEIAEQAKTRIAELRAKVATSDASTPREQNRLNASNPQAEQARPAVRDESRGSLGNCL